MDTGDKADTDRRVRVASRCAIASGRPLLVAALGCSVLAAAIAAGAQRPAALPRIAFLGMDTQMQAERVAAFRDALRELGYVEGRTIVIDYRSAEGRFDQLPALAVELVASNPDVIVTAAPPAVRAVQGATTTIPIVMGAHDPIGMGFVGSFAKPGGNITGVAFQDSELSTKRLDLLRQAVPNLTRVAVFWNKEGGGMAAVTSVEGAAKALGLQVLRLEVSGPADFAGAVASAKAWGAQGLIQLASPLITKHRQIFLEQLRVTRLPATCEMREYVEEGCLMTYSANLNMMFRMFASFVDRILKGAKPSDLAIEQPREFEFVINQKTAQTLGLTLPSTLTLQATEIIR